MIRVKKNEVAPVSLSNTTAYDGEDVRKQLLEDQQEKCYICERRVSIDFEIEHRQSEENYEELSQNWNNLLLVCPYCNKKKLHRFDGILDPIACDIEEEILQNVDFGNNKAIFVPLYDSDAHRQTAHLLDRVFNGRAVMRTVREEKFFECFLSQINRFLVLINAFLSSPTEELNKAVADDLTVSNEYLGFKYWIIKEHPVLYRTFAENIVWNKNSRFTE